MVVDLARLVVSLEAESRKYMEGLDRANARTEKFQRQVQGRLNSLTAGFKSFGASLLAGVSYAGFQKLIDSLDQIQESAKAAGLGAETFQAWGLAAKQAGISSDAFASGMARANKVIGDAANGNKKAADLFARLGVSIYDVNGNVRGTEPIILDFADALQRLGSNQQDAADSAALFGREFGPKFLAVLSDGSAGLKGFTEQAKAMGLVISEQTLKEADKFNDSLDTLGKVTLVNLAAAISPLLPLLTDLANRFATAAQKASEYFKASNQGQTKSDQEAIDRQRQREQKLFQFIRDNAPPGTAGLFGDPGKVHVTGFHGPHKQFGTERGFEDQPPAAAPAGIPGKTSEQIAAEKAARAKYEREDEDFLRGVKATYDAEYEERKVAHAKMEADDEDFWRGVKSTYDADYQEFVDLQEKIKAQSDEFGNLFVDNLVQASDSGFQSIVTSFGRMIAQMILKAQASRLFEYLFPKGFSASAGGAVGSIAGFLGFRASGGPVMAGGSYIVGESGPELFTPGASGNITPNGALGGTTNINVDARGAQDPALTAATVKAAVTLALAKASDNGKRGR